MSPTMASGIHFVLEALGGDLMIIAYLHPSILKTGMPYSGRYAVSIDGEKIVANSRDPETDLARALIARGITGMVKMLDADTGKHRSTVNIEKAARVVTKEGPLRFETYGEAIPDRSPAGESDLEAA
jgi:hypothetical protein